MEYYGIQTPDKPGQPSYIWWITDSEHNSWMAFFNGANKEGKHNAYRLPLAEAKKAYEWLGYKCVELKLEIVDNLREG